MSLEEFKIKFQVEQYKLFETNHWVWSLRPNQATLGSGVLSLKRLCRNFSEVTQDEFADMSNIIKVIEKSLKMSFSFDKINYLMLMMVDNHIHFHIIPRYKNKIVFAGIEWYDEGWPKLPILSGDSTNPKLLEEICKKIKNNIILE